MTPALASLLALIVAIVLSIVTRINVGLVAIGFAWIIGVYMAGLGADAVIRGFPSSLFLTLAGVTLLFGAAEANGTLERLAHQAVRLARGDARLLPIMFFVIAAFVASVGPGALNTVALIAPLAMAIAHRAGVPYFLTTLMVANGANAGNLSPFSAVGIIANSRMADAGLAGHEAKVFFANFVVHVVVSAAAYFLLGGARLSGRAAGEPPTGEPIVPLNGQQRLTLVIAASWILGVLFLRLNVGFSAFAAATLLAVFRAVDDAVAVRKMPWRVIVMVCGVTTLIGLLETTGGMDLFTRLLAQLAGPSTVNGMIALVTGAISTYSSTSGVVLPAFLPTVPGLVQNLGGGDPLAIALSINVGSALVDVSPLSTSGALCLAAVPDPQQATPLFRKLLIWGLSMAVVGAILCQLFAGPFARA